MGRVLRSLTAVVLTLAALGCYQQEMADQARYDPLGESDFFEDRMASRLPIEGTVARGQLYLDAHLYRGIENGQPATSFPVPVDLELVRRGKERYEIFCTPCHDRVGNGNGIVVQRGYRRPSSFHVDRLRQAPPGYFFDVITNGFATMPSYAAQVPVRDRWAIIAYVRALQLSQYAPREVLSQSDLQELGGAQ